MASGSIFSTKVDTSQRIMSIDFYDEDRNIKVTFPAGRSLDFEEKTDHGGFDPEIDRDYFFCFNLNYRHPYQLRQILMEHVERLLEKAEEAAPAEPAGQARPRPGAHPRGRPRIHRRPAKTRPRPAPPNIDPHPHFRPSEIPRYLR